MNAQLIISNDDQLTWSDGSASPLFTINHNVIEEIRNFRRLHPDITTEFFNQELNTAIVELLFRIDHESRGAA
jgi:hypothetical protein